jgi:two-component system cell cycle sensor histidine kinase/response regulator CckA
VPLPKPTVAAPSPSSAQTILLVEDDASVRLVGRLILEGAGYEVLEAEGKAAALEALDQRTGEVDLVITDVVMPDGGGPALAEEVGARYPGTQILFLTGYSASEFEERETELRHPLLTKPFTPDSLAAAVRQQLAESAESGAQGAAQG